MPLTGPRERGQLEPIAAGFPLLCAPAYALGGRLAVELWLAALAALGYVAAAWIARRIVPDPWATRGVLAVGLSPPAVVAATTIAPDAVAASALAGAAALALAARERPLARLTAWAGPLLATLPWLGVRFVAPGAVVLVGVFRWPRRRQRGLAGLVGVEVALFSTVLFVSINDRLYGGLTPYAVLPEGESPTGAHGLAAHLERWPRLLWLWVGRPEGLLLWAPVCAMAFVALWLLARSRRERLARVLGEQADVEVTAGFLARGVRRRRARGGLPLPHHRRAVVRRPRARRGAAADRRASELGPASLPARRRRARRPHGARSPFGCWSRCASTATPASLPPRGALPWTVR